MDVRFVPPDLRRLDEMRSEALALALFEDERPLRGALGLIDWRLSGQLSQLLIRGRASGRHGETVLVPTRNKLPVEKLFVFGAGPMDALDDAVFDQVVERMLTTLDQAKVRASVVALPGRSLELVAPEHAMKIFLGRALEHPEQDTVTLIESVEAQREMMPVVERERRRERAEDWD